MSGVAAAKNADEQPKASAAPGAEFADDSDGDGDLDRPDSVSASFTARALKKRVEDLSRRTETTRTFANADGTWTDEQTQGVARVQSGDGTWQDVDYDLALQPDGSWTPKVSPVDVTISNGSSHEAARVTFEDDQSLAVTWPQPLPEPTVDGGVATYKISDSTDLVVTTTSRGVNTHIRLNSPPTENDPVFELGLRTDDLDVKESGAGYKLVDDDGKTIGGTSNLVAWDAKTDESGSPLEVVPLESNLEETGSAGDVTNHSLELTTPSGYLNDPTTEYPVIIDPDLGTIERLRDTYVRNGDGNHQYESNLAVGKISGESNLNEARAYLKFHTGNYLPGQQIIRAEMRLWQFYAGTCSNAAMEIWSISQAWTGGMTWSTQPPLGPAAFAIGENHGANGCGDDWTRADMTGIVAGWANGSLPNEGINLRVPGANANTATYGRRFCSMDTVSGTICNTADHMPKLSVTYNRTPYAPSAVSIEGGSSNGSTMLTNEVRPRLNAQISDPDGDATRALFNVANSGGTVWQGWTSYGDTNRVAGLQVPVDLSDGTYTVKALTNDGNQDSPWGPSKTLVVDHTAPALPTVSCTNVVSGQWYSDRPTPQTTCTVNGPADTKRFDWELNNKVQPFITTSDGSETLGTFDVPTNGVFGISVKAVDAAGNLSAPGKFGFGSGDAGMITPIDGERTSSTVLVEAQGPSNLSSARIEHRPAGSDAAPWVTAAKVSPLGSSFPWLGTVTDAANNSVTTGKLVWDISAESGITKPSVRETRVCFTFAGGDKCTPSRTVTVVPTAFGSSFPTDEVGPGQVALFTGEFQVTESDVEVPAYDGTLSLGRSHRSYAGDTSPAAGVFGPGWVAALQGPEAGAGSVDVIDRTATEASITLVNPDGSSATYTSEQEYASPQLPDYYIGNAETKTENNLLELVDGPTKKLVLSEDDGTETTWTHLGSGKWVVEKVVEPQNNGTTTYTHDAAGLVTGIYAPTPSGVTCNATAQTAGCRALWLTYTTINGKTRLDKIDLRIWDPKPTAAGLPGSTAGMTTTTVQRYEYNTDADTTLKAAWDPRMDGTSGPLKTTYEYAKIGSKTVLTKATPPGETPWRFEYNTTTSSADYGKLVNVRRDQPAGMSGEAVWTVQYGTPLSGTGLPDLTPSSVATWGQVTAPVGASTVYGPDASGTSDKTYGSMSYFDVEGRTTNTAEYGAGAWQIDSSVYDAKGNVVWALDAGARSNALGYGAASAAIGNNLATLTIYNEEAPGIPAGTRVEKSYGPTRPVVLENGSTIYGRAFTTTTYDDEAATALVPGRPVPAANEPAKNLPVEEESGVVDSTANVSDVDRTRYQYDTVVAGDGNGWDLKTPTRVKTQVGSGWSTELTRFDTEGKVVETRTPQGTESTDGTGSDPRSTKTVYYTVGTSAARTECRNAPAWAGQVCWTGPAGQPSSGQPVPETVTTGYSVLGVPTRQVKSSGAAAHVNVIAYDASGRVASASETTSGMATSDRAVATKTMTYSATTGALKQVSNGTQTQTIGYDGWGRATEQSDGTGNTSTTTYDTAGRIKTVDDGKGVVTYTYDGTDSKGRPERRGLVTKLDAGLPSGTGTDEFTGSYDAFGSLIEQTSPGDVITTWTYDVAGIENGKSFTYQGVPGASYAQAVDIKSRVRLQQSASSFQDFKYDDRDRLVQVGDYTGSACNTRRYTFSGDSNRTALTTYGPASDGQCQTSTPAGVATTSFDGADRTITSSYSYDELGRTRTVPAADTTETGGGTLSVSYHANDMVATTSQDVSAGNTTVTKAQDYTLDASDRISVTKNLAGGVSLSESTNHYNDNSDSPAWTETKSRPDASSPWVTTWNRYVSGLDGELALTQRSDGYIQTHYGNLHGDVTILGLLGTTGLAGIQSYSEYTEYGLARDVGNTPMRYGWLGTKQRDNTVTGGLTLMGARVYNPATGRFLSRDPLTGGNDNTYVYPADPVNMFDLNGAFGLPKWVNPRNIARVAAYAGGAAALAACGASVVCAVGAGAASAAAAYTAKHAKNKQSPFRPTQLVKQTLAGAATGGLKSKVKLQSGRQIYTALRGGKVQRVGKPSLRPRPQGGTHKGAKPKFNPRNSLKR